MCWGKMKTAAVKKERGEDEVILDKLVIQVMLVGMKSLLGPRDCAVYILQIIIYLKFTNSLVKDVINPFYMEEN